MDRIIYITEDITPSSGEHSGDSSLIKKISYQLLALAATGNKPIHLLIDTDGGNLKTALTLYDLIEACPCEVYTYALSEVSSAGVLIYLAGSKRYAFKNSQFMTHPSSLSVSGNHLEFDSSVGAVKKQGLLAKKLYKKVLGITNDEWNEIHDNTIYIMATEAKKRGIVTSIIKKYPEALLKSFPAPPPEVSIEELHAAIKEEIEQENE